MTGPKDKLGIIPFKPHTIQHKEADDATIAIELLAMANRVEELAQTSNMQNWMLIMASNLRSIALSYKGD